MRRVRIEAERSLLKILQSVADAVIEVGNQSEKHCPGPVQIEHTQQISKRQFDESVSRRDEQFERGTS